MTQFSNGEKMCARNLAARCARALRRFHPRKATRGRSATPRGEQGKPDARCTRGLVCKGHRKNAHEHTGSAEAIRLSLRSGFTAYGALSPVNGLSCHRRPRDTSRALDAGIGASGPHVFAVRIGHARQSQLSRPPHPTARSWRSRAAPLIGWDRPDKPV